MRLAAFALLAVSFSTNVFAQAGLPLASAPLVSARLADSPLPPGRPAGVHQAVQQSTENAILIGMGVAGIAVSAYLVATAKKSSASSATATSP
jgi:hypothetical protein